MTKEELKSKLKEINLEQLTDSFVCCGNCANGEQNGAYCKLSSIKMLDCLDKKKIYWELRNK